MAPMFARGKVLATWITALRPHHWIKNLLLFVPLAASHRLLERALIIDAVVAFACFCAASSAVYIVNDILDAESDRRHPSKQNRPFAARTLQPKYGYLIASLLLVAAFAGGAMLNGGFVLALAAYNVVGISYSVWLKHVALVDALVLAGLYALRIEAGGLATGIAVSFWLLALSIFLFVSLAFLKRYAEMQALANASRDVSPGRDYHTNDIPILLCIGISSGNISVLVLALYINTPAGASLYSHPEYLWGLCICLLYWVNRLWFIAHRGRMDADPLLFAVRDRISHLVGVIAASIAWLAS